MSNEEQTPLVPEQGSSGTQTQAPEGQDFVSMETYKNARARMTQATQETAQLRRELAAMQSGRGVQAPAEQTDESDADMAGWIKEYPDFAGPIVKRLNRQQEAFRSLETQNKSLMDQNSAIQRDAFVQSVSSAHPDVNEVVNSDDFKGWLSRQPGGVSQMANYGSASDVSYVLDQYKGGTRNTPDTSRLDAARSAATPSVRSNKGASGVSQPKSFTREQISAMSPAEFDQNETAIDAAMAAGLVA